MGLENTGSLLREARNKRYCIGAFNVVDFLTMEAVVKTALEEHAPVILQTSAGTVNRFGAPALVQMARLLVGNSNLPVGLHLDHGVEFSMIEECIQAGYTSVMIDASHYPFDENVARTLQVVHAARANGVAVEAEIGILPGVEDDLSVELSQASYTTPEEARAFQAATGVDFLAVAIGTAHGFYKSTPKLNIETLAQLRRTTDFPLVVHGGTGLSFSTIRELVKAGCSKMNVSTQLKKTYIDALYEYLGQHPEEYNPIKLMNYATKQLAAVVAAYLQVFNSSGKARV
ncbi:MAG: class II fructose-bisphosphate aldolase [Anaerolineales bacterium]|jgi:ketose-bisphosphate aldolase|nr:class II fructose-bisphosphate aldolase [Anaerolineales bacterium]